MKIPHEKYMIIYVFIRDSQGIDFGGGGGSKKEILKFIFRLALVGWLSWLERFPLYQNGPGFDPWSGQIWEATNKYFLSHPCFSRTLYYQENYLNNKICFPVCYSRLKN